MEEKKSLNNEELEKVAGGVLPTSYAIIWYCPECDREIELYSGGWEDVEWEMEHPDTCPDHPQTKMLFRRTKMI